VAADPSLTRAVAAAGRAHRRAHPRSRVGRGRDGGFTDRLADEDTAVVNHAIAAAASLEDLARLGPGVVEPSSKSTRAFAHRGDRGSGRPRSSVLARAEAGPYPCSRLLSALVGARAVAATAHPRRDLRGAGPGNPGAGAPVRGVVSGPTRARGCGWRWRGHRP
jgi:hypothetical protein